MMLFGPWVEFLLVVLATNLAHSSLDSSDALFTSSSDLELLLGTGGEIAKQLTEYIEKEEKRLAILKTYIREYDAMYQEASMDVEKFVGNPLNSFRMIKRLTSDWKTIRSLLSSVSSGEALINELSNRTVEHTLKWPSDEDLNGAATALTRLEDTYNLRPGDMADGYLSGKSFGTHFSSNDCFEVGRQSYNNGDYDHTIQWMTEAMNKWESESSKTVERSEILEYLAFSYYSINDLERALLHTNELLALVPDHPRAGGNKVYYEEVLKAEKAKVNTNKKGDDGTEDTEVSDLKMASFEEYQSEYDKRFTKYQRLCRGETVPSEHNRDKLKCKYVHGFHPYLTLMPHKMEEVNLDPRIEVYHDVLSDNEIARIKESALPKFKRATVQNSQSGNLETASYRISKTAWLKRGLDPDIDRVYDRIGHLTGLSMESSEELQVSNYGMGGHYEPHFDFARKEESKAFESLGMGNRIATWMFYASDVELGGATVFTAADVAVRPKKGSAVFWYNLYKNGEGDERTVHAACPVLAGAKWVSNFWIHERGQEFARPCSLSPYE